MRYNYTPMSHGSADMHNRCLGGRAWCVNDICGIVCAVMTWLLIIFAEYVVLYVILVPTLTQSKLYGVCNIFVFQLLAILAFCSHIRTMLTDPGAVPRGNATKFEVERMGYQEGQVFFKCPKCCSIKPERAHHCSVCHRCIRKMDHHCPWVNNCVGENNQKFFVLFTFYIAVISIHAIFLTFMKFGDCVQDEWHTCSPYSPPTTIFLLLVLIFEGFMFAIFTIIMLLSQLSAILNDKTGIEQLKKEEARIKKSRLKSIQSVFGRFSIAWFSPFTNPACKKFDSHFYTV